jgi:hypothetical protein
MPRRELKSWKEIAEFLRLSVRKAQMMEKEDGMPVHRSQAGSRAPVHAFTDELIAWSAGRKGQPGPEPMPVPSPAAEVRTERKYWGRSRQVAAVVGCLAVAGLLMAARRLFPERVPSGVTLRGQLLVMLDQNGATLWDYPLPEQPVPLPISEEAESPSPLIADIDGDGRRVLLYNFHAARGGGPPDMLYCFEQGGRLRWSRQIGRELHTRKTAAHDPITYAAHYDLMWIVILGHPTPSGGRIVVGGYRGGTSLFLVEVLTPSGKVVGEYYHPGWLWGADAADLDGDGNEEIILGGVNDAYGALPDFRYPMTIVVLDSRRVAGEGPAPPDDLRHFEELTPGHERAVLLLPEFGAVPGKRLEDFCKVERIRSGPGYFDAQAIRSGHPDLMVDYHFDRHLNADLILPGLVLAPLIDKQAGAHLMPAERLEYYRQRLAPMVLKNEFAKAARREPRPAVR